MDTAVVEQLLDEMLSSLEELETKTTATLRYLKDKGHVADKDLAPYLEQAGNASNVRWRAARLRMMSLLSSALKSAEESPTKQEQPKQENRRPDNDKKQNTAPETVAETKTSAEAATPQAHEETDRSQDKIASQPKETQVSESKDQQMDRDRKAPNAEVPADTKNAQKSPQEGAA